MSEDDARAHLDRGGPTTGMVTIDRHLYLTEDKTRVVEEGDPAGRWLWARPGLEVPRADAERLGAVKPEVKQAPQPEDKAADPPENKAADKPEVRVRRTRRRGED